MVDKNPNDEEAPRQMRLNDLHLVQPARVYQYLKGDLDSETVMHSWTRACAQGVDSFATAQNPKFPTNQRVLVSWLLAFLL